MLKKSAALITCLMLALSLLVGCSGSDNAAGTAGNEEIEINVLSATMRLDAMVDGWEEMIAKFEEENPGVKVNLEMQEWEAIPQYLPKRGWPASRLISFVLLAARSVLRWPQRGL